MKLELDYQIRFLKKHSVRTDHGLVKLVSVLSDICVFYYMIPFIKKTFQYFVKKINLEVVNIFKNLLYVMAFSGTKKI